MYRPNRKNRKTDSKSDIYQAAHREVEPERVHKGAVADACGHTLDMTSLLHSLNSLLAGEEILGDMPTANFASERPLAVSRASSVEEFGRDEDKLIVDGKNSEEELERIEYRQDAASSRVELTSAASSFFHREQSARSFEAIQSHYGPSLLPSKVTDVIVNLPQNG